MFEVKFVVRDKGLPAALRAVESYALEPPAVTPLGATTEEEPARRDNTKPSTELLLDFIKQNNLKNVTARQMKEHLISCGLTGSAYSFALTKLLQLGALKKNKSSAIPHSYEVMSK